MRVFVAGATGVIGQYLVPSLVAAGHEVTGTTRSTTKAAACKPPVRRRHRGRPGPPGRAGRGQGRAARGDRAPDDRAGQHEQLPQLRQEFAVTNELRVKGTDYLLEAAQEAGTRRFIAQSFVGWNNARTGGPVKTEQDPLDPTRSRRPGRRWRRSGIWRRPCPARRPRDSCSVRLLLRSRRLRLHARRGAQAADARHRRGHGHLVVLRGHGRRRRDPRGHHTGRAGIYNIVDDDPAPVRDGCRTWPGASAQGAQARPGLAGRLLAGELVVG